LNVNTFRVFLRGIIRGINFYPGLGMNVIIPKSEITYKKALPK